MQTLIHPFSQIRAAYIAMAREARYRPAAPSDGCGNIGVPLRSLNLDGEADLYAHEWNEHENGNREEGPGHTYSLGYPSYSDRPALIYIVEAARNLNSGIDNRGHAVAARLLRMALREIEADK